MKKIAFLLVFSLVSTFIYAQEEPEFGFNKGDLFLSGNVLFGTDTTDDTKRTNIEFNPVIGYFISDHFTLQGGFLVSYMKLEDRINGSDLDTNGLGIGLGTSYFFTPKRQFSFLLNLSGFYQRFNALDIVRNEIDFNRTTFQFSPGLNYFISENFALQATFGFLSYTSSSSNDQVASDLSQFAVGLNLSNVNFGILFKL